MLLPIPNNIVGEMPYGIMTYVSPAHILIYLSGEVTFIVFIFSSHSKLTPPGIPGGPLSP